MKNFISEKRIVYFLLSALFLMFFLISYFSEGTYDAGDGIRHYLISRYSWKHPELFLNSWGKPFFTFVSSPFSQFGLLGINVFNILCALSSSFISYKIAKKLNLNYPYLVIIFLCFTPLYFATINSGLTEPFFGLVLISSIYLLLEEKYLWSALLISFLPYVRTEGIFILPLFFIVLAYRKKFLPVVSLSFGSIITSIAGAYYYHDILWVKNQNPYDGSNKGIYGQGELLHFTDSHNYIWGSVLTALLLAGFIAIVFNVLINKFSTEKTQKLPTNNIVKIILIAGSFIVYLVAHSIMWWKGWANSLGLLRVLSAVMPCSALICLSGFNLIMDVVIRKNKYVQYTIVVLVSYWVIRSPFEHEFFPYKLDMEQTLIKEAGEWYKKSPYTKHKIYYIYPYLGHVLDVDCFDGNKVAELWGLYPTIKEHGIKAIPDSTIILWDAHFGPNECKIAQSYIMNDPDFQLVKIFKPAVPFKVLGGYDFEVDAFMKLHSPRKADVLSADFFDLETGTPVLSKTETIEEGDAFSGTHVCKLLAKNEYGVTIKKLVSQIPDNNISINFECKLLDAADNSKDALIVLSVEDAQGKNLLWSSNAVVPVAIEGNAKWKNVKTQFFVSPKTYPADAIIKVYVWNPKHKEFSIDDMSLKYFGTK